MTNSQKVNCRFGANTCAHQFNLLFYKTGALGQCTANTLNAQKWGNLGTLLKKVLLNQRLKYLKTVKNRHGFNVRGVREHIDNACATQSVAGLVAQDFDISC